MFSHHGEPSEKRRCFTSAHKSEPLCKITKYRVYVTELISVGQRMLCKRARKYGSDSIYGFCVANERSCSFAFGCVRTLWCMRGPWVNRTYANVQNSFLETAMEIESEGGSSERITTWVLWTVEKISNIWDSWTSMWFSCRKLNVKGSPQAGNTELYACQYHSVEYNKLNCTIRKYYCAEFRAFFIPRSQPCLLYYFDFVNLTTLVFTGGRSHRNPHGEPSRRRRYFPCLHKSEPQCKITKYRV